MNKREQLIDQLLKDLDAATNGVRFISSRTHVARFWVNLGRFSPAWAPTHTAGGARCTRTKL